ncbi:MAG: IS5 family transposase [bacterium]|nr:IS5 family transposase [bacterium]
MDWKETDERLIRRGELILDPKHLENPRQELKTMNKHKRGRNYHISNTYIQLLAAIRYLYGMPYRQLEGFTRALHRLVPTTPTRADYSGIRKRILRLSVDPYRDLKETNEPVTIAVDSTGISVHKAGGWIERKHGKKRRYVKLHFAVNVETHEVVSMEVSTDDVHDVKALPGLVDGAEANVEVSKVIGDGAYDSSRVYALLEGRGIEVVVKPRGNGRSDRGHPGRRRAVELVRSLGFDGWAKLTGYGRRWAVETAYSTFKRLFGEHSLARSFENIARELVGKVALYNMMVNM